MKHTAKDGFIGSLYEKDTQMRSMESKQKHWLHGGECICSGVLFPHACSRSSKILFNGWFKQIIHKHKDSMRVSHIVSQTVCCISLSNGSEVWSMCVSHLFRLLFCFVHRRVYANFVWGSRANEFYVAITQFFFLFSISFAIDTVEIGGDLRWLIRYYDVAVNRLNGGKNKRVENSLSVTWMRDTRAHTLALK